ncbi:MAG: PKD domain-containing protein [Bacteroidetes bacterium]|nr:PKD domain-containing protein [Bacteroidota bacterium]
MRNIYKPFKMSIFLLIAFIVSLQTKAQTYLINETFDNFSGLPTSGWSNHIIAGDSLYDNWLFNNPGNRSTSSPILGKFAIFDSDYNSQNGGAENVAMESPSFNATGFAEVHLMFDQKFAGIYNSTDSILVEVYNGSSWVSVYSYNGSAMSNTQDLKITSQVGTVTNAKVRFRFVGDWSYYWIVDNVRVLGYFNYDALTLNAKFSSGTCGSSNDSVMVDLANGGLQSISNFTVKANMAGTLGNNSVNSTVSATYTGSLAPGGKGSIMMPPFNTSTGGNVILSAWTELSNEQNFANDTLHNATTQFIGTPSAPSANTVSRCGQGDVTLQALNVQSGDSIVWYDDPSSKAPVGSGISYTTPDLSPGKYSYYVSSGRGALSSKLSTAFNANNGQSGVMFDVAATRTVVLDSFEVSIDAGTYTVEVYYKQGTYVGFETNASAWTLLGSTSVTSTTSSGGSGTYVNVGNKLTLADGSTYAFYIQVPNVSTGIVNYTNGSGQWGNSELQITTGVGKGSNFGSTFSPRSFNGTLFYNYYPLCESNRTSVDITVNSLPTGSSITQGTPFKGTFKSGTASDPHIVADGDSVRFNILPPSGYSNSDFGTTWEITNINISTPNGGNVPSTDTATILPSANADGNILFVPSLSISDSLYRFEATIHSMLTGCDSLVEAYLYIAPRPHAQFTYQPTCDGQDMVFVNQSSILKGILSYEWNFGSGATASTDQNPSYLFPTSGNYPVILKVISDYGYVDFDTVQVVVKEVPATSFKAVNACEGSDIQLSNTTMMPQGATSFHWDFGDGNGDNQQNTSHRYSSAGYYTVTYTVDVNGCSNTTSKTVTQAPRAKVNYSYTASCNNTEVKFNNHSTLAFGTMGYSWEFGDSKTSNSTNPSHIYQGFGVFDVMLKAHTNLGCVDSFQSQVVVIQAPQVNLSYSNPCVREAIQFMNNAVVPAGFTNSYKWTFGDGAVSSDANPSHSYSAVGNYTLKLLSFSTNGCSDSVEVVVTIGEKPIAGIVAPTVICDGNEVNLQNASVSSMPGSISYEWDLGNGTVTQAHDTSLIYAGPGTYKVHLYAIMPGGCSDTAIKSIRVSANPSAVFSAVSAQMMNGTMIFQPLATGAGISYVWKFGDGNTSTQQSPTHQYVYDGNFTAQLITKNADQCISTTFQNVSIHRTGLNDLSLDAKMRLYPNPNKGRFTLELDGATFDHTSAKVVNSLGQEVQAIWNLETNSRALIDLSTAKPGVYFVILNNDNGQQAQLQFVIQ